MDDFTSLLHFAAPCGSNACFHVDETADGFTFTSTIDGNDGAVTYTPAEVAEFLTAVQAGKWDHLLERAQARVGAQEPVIA